MDKIDHSKKQRKLAAIMFTDMVGYSALAQKNESLAIELLEEHRKLLRPLFPKHGGTEVETVGDAFFVEFKSALEAVNCAIDIQKLLFDRNSKLEAERQIKLRIGLHIGDVIHVGKHVHGDGVNIAARLEPLSKPGGICLSEDVARQIQNKIELPLKNLGSEKLKNIKSPIDIFCVLLPWENNQEFKNKRFIQKLIKKKSFRYTAIASVVLLAFFVFWYVIQATLLPARNNRLAVLPLENMSKDPENEYFADGLTEELISQLAKIRGLSVIARTSVIKYKNADLGVGEIGKELNVGSILAGSVQKAEKNARITVKLSDTNSEEVLWSAKYNTELKDIFSIQNDISLKIVKELKVQLLSSEIEQLQIMGTENTEAYQSYLLGKFHLNKRTEESIYKSLNYFEESINLDPDYALAYVGIADCYTLIGGGAYSSLPLYEITQKAKDAVNKALNLDQSLAEAHNSMAYINFRLEWDWEEADKNFKKAIQLKPGYAVAYERFGFYRALLGHFDEALKIMFRAQELNPLSASVGSGIGRIYHFARQYDKAIQQYQRTLKIAPDYVEAILGLSLTYEQKGMYDQALVELEKSVKLSNNRPIVLAALGNVYARSGRRDEAIRILDDLTDMTSDPISPFYSAIVNTTLGNKQEAIDALYKAYEEHFGLLVYIKVSPFFDQLRNEPQFISLKEKMGF